MKKKKKQGKKMRRTPSFQSKMDSSHFFNTREKDFNVDFDVDLQNGKLLNGKHFNNKTVANYGCPFFCSFVSMLIN